MAEMKYSFEYDIDRIMILSITANYSIKIVALEHHSSFNLIIYSITCVA